MEPIELEHWGPDPNDPRKMKYIGQPKAEEVFKALEQRLESKGYLPDEYFLMDHEWENGREIPRCADIFCATDYGGSEGIYVDVYLKWNEGGKPITKSFATGKTLGETGADLDKMFLIASEITKAFHGDRGQYARYAVLGKQEEASPRIISLTPEEQRVFINALLEQRERILADTIGVEQLLRRMTGSITEYMDLVGQRPLRVSDYDKTVLAIHDGNLIAFQEYSSAVLDHADDLLMETTGRCGAVGRKMLLHLFTNAEEFSSEAYMTACKNAIEIRDKEKSQFLLEQASDYVKDISPDFQGRVLLEAYAQDRELGTSLICASKPEWIAATPPELLYRAAGNGHLTVAERLIQNGLQPGMIAEAIVSALTMKRSDQWMVDQLLKHGMEVPSQCYGALAVCIRNNAPEVAMLLMDHGINYEGYLAWAEKNHGPVMDKEMATQLEQHWQEIAQQPQEPTMGEMTL